MSACLGLSSCHCSVVSAPLIVSSAALPKTASPHVSKYHLISHQHRSHSSELHFTARQRRLLSKAADRHRGRHVPAASTVVGALAGGSIVFGNRIPQHDFVTKGFGETDEGAGEDPYETGSYDLALQEAEIDDFNIQTYTSVMPVQAIFLTLEQAKPYFQHGSVLECIMASMNGNRGDRISAGVGRAKVMRISDQTLIGGYAVEYEGHASEAVVMEILRKDLQDIFKRRFDEKKYEMYDFEYMI
eukprot:c23809_g2_i3 orf=288-1019(-)